MTALVPALVQVGLVPIEDGLPVGSPEQKLVDTGGAVEAAHSGVVQPQFPADRRQRLALGDPFLHRRVALMRICEFPRRCSSLHLLDFEG